MTTRRAVRGAVVIDDTGPRHRSKKDGKRWCAGHVGREHQWGAWWHGSVISLRTCAVCGRKDWNSDRQRRATKARRAASVRVR